MKKILVLLSFSLIILSCRKNTPEQKNIKHFLRDGDGTAAVTMFNGMPHYATAEDYQTVYESLTSQYEANQQSLATTYQQDSYTDDEYNTIGWTVWAKLQDPLIEFEQSVGFRSYRFVTDSAYAAWLKLQGEDLDTPSHPYSLAVSPVQKAMMNADGDYAIADSIYHFDDSLHVYQIVGLTNINYLDSLKTVYKTTGFGGIINWLENIDDHIHITVFGQPSGTGGLRTDCTTNHQYSKWVNVDSKTKYLERMGWYYDFSKTSATGNIEAEAKIKIVFVSAWVPALTNLKMALQIYYYNTDCSDQRAEYIGPNSFWGPLQVTQRNYWGNRFTFVKGIPNGNNSYPADGFWMWTWVKNVGGGATGFTPLVLP